MGPGDDFLTISEAAKRFSIPPSRIRQWIERKRLREYAPEGMERPTYVKIEEIQAVIDGYNRIVPKDEG